MTTSLLDRRWHAAWPTAHAGLRSAPAGRTSRGRPSRTPPRPRRPSSPGPPRGTPARATGATLGVPSLATYARCAEALEARSPRAPSWVSSASIVCWSMDPSPRRGRSGGVTPMSVAPPESGLRHAWHGHAVHSAPTHSDKASPPRREPASTVSAEHLDSGVDRASRPCRPMRISGHPGRCS
jgi:hypothetical protein